MENSQDLPDFKNLAHLSPIKSVTCETVTLATDKWQLI